MVNPKGNLAGWSDPEDPNWRTNVLDAVRAQQAGKAQRQRRRAAYLALWFDPEYNTMLDMAARRRGMTKGSYGRRALAAFIAKDLGIPITDVLQHCATPTPYGVDAVGGFKKGPTTDDGTGYGEWSI